jgi:uroporphyrin-III C-methyltransferase
MTLRGVRLLKAADVVIHDRLVPLEVLEWCREDAEKIDVGKYPEHHRVSQEEINDLLVDRARHGNVVVRLKGGDPFVFGRGFEELETCRRHNIPCTVVPGISSSISAPSAAGIPVTSRGIARSFAVVTGQTDPNLGNYAFDFDALSRMDTIVLLMARKNLAEITKGLIEAGLDPKTPAASIENATCDNQRVTAASASTIADVVKALGIDSPMVTVIGEVASMVNRDLVELPEIVRQFAT